MNKFSKKTKYIRTDAWRGYYEPICGIVGWNDTGAWSDSPCPTKIGSKEANLAKNFLRKHKIPFRTLTCSSSNIFCVHHYLITTVEKLDEARELLNKWYPTIKYDTRLLYLVN